MHNCKDKEERSIEIETQFSSSTFLRFPFGAGSIGVRAYVTFLVTTRLTLIDDEVLPVVLTAPPALTGIPPIRLPSIEYQSWGDDKDEDDMTVDRALRGERAGEYGLCGTCRRQGGLTVAERGLT